MNQGASWIGLGWNLSLGQISRGMKGIPDDYSGERISEITAIDLLGDASASEEKRDGFGPVHFKELYDHNLGLSGGDEKLMDLYVSRHGAFGDEVSFEYPDYDNFHVSGPGIGGVMQPFMFDYANMYRPEADDGTTYGDPQDSDYQKFHRKPQFRFKNEPATRIYSPFYGRYSGWRTLPASSSYGVAEQTFKTAYELRPDPNNWFENYGTPQMGDSLDFMTGFSSNCPDDEWVKWSSNYVEYFLNSDIPSETGFMEYETGVNRALPPFAQDGIGAFRVTTPSGMVYHYSLPVYTTKETVSDFALDDDNDPITNDTELPVKIYEKSSAYANSWKLTAITGQDYVDANSNGVVDQGDTGYWVAIEYEKWASTSSRSPYYGYHFDQRLKNHLTSGEQRIWSEKDYVPKGTVSESDFEVYYPKRVMTATHMAYFVYDVRMDNHGVDDDIPSLKLTRMVLINSGDSEVFDYPLGLTSTHFPNITTHNDINNFLLVSEDHYTQANNIEEIEDLSLQTVEFEYDHSLALGVYNNILNTTNTLGSVVKVAADDGDLSEYHNDLYTPITAYGTPPANSGRLTLKEIKMFGDKHRAYRPSYKFEYATSTHNPNYNHETKDFFGFYKRNYDADYKGGYITETFDEHLHVDAWSMKRIITPLGGEITVDYESDVYHKVCYDAGTSPNWKFPKRIFRIKEISKGSVNDPFEIYLFNSDGYGYVDSDQLWKIGMGYRTYCDLAGVCESGTEGFDATDLGLTHQTSPADHLEWNGTLCGCPELASDWNEDVGWGYIQFRLNEAYGGGIRVKEISVTEPELNETYSLTYDYGGGVATTEPDRFVGLNKDGWSNTLLMSTHGSDRHARGSAVGYDKVSYSITGQNNISMGSVGFEFNNYFNDLLPNHIKYVGSAMLSVVGVDDYSIAGRIKERQQFDNQNVMVSRTSYEYSDPFLDKDNGVVGEVFYLKTTGGGNITKKSVFRKRHISRYLKKTAHWEGDKLYVKEVKERDPLTGITTLGRSTNPADGVEVTKSILEYTNNAELSTPHLNSSNRNILTAVSSKFVYAEEEDAANIRNAVSSDWNNDFDYWDWDAATDSYVRETGLDKYLKEETRVYNGESSEENWKTASNITMLDEVGRIVETKDAGERFSSTRFGYSDNRHTIASAQNSPFQAFTHCSFEDDEVEPESGITYFEGNVLMRSGVQVESNLELKAHTGSHYVSLEGATSNDNGPVFIIKKDLDGTVERGIEPGRTYVASVWVNNSSARYTGIEILLEGSWSGGSSLSVSKDKSDEGLVLGDWKRLEVQLTVPDDYTTGSGNDDLRVRLYVTAGIGYFDDLRVQPLDSKVEGMVYDHRTGWLTHSLNNDNVGAMYEYDPMGRAIRVYSETEEGFIKQVEVVENFGRNN